MKAAVCAPLKLDKLTDQGFDKMATVSQTTFSNTFSCMKMYECWMNFHWFCFKWFTVFYHWAQIIIQPIIVSLLTHICITLHQGVFANKNAYTARASFPKTWDRKYLRLFKGQRFRYEVSPESRHFVKNVKINQEYLFVNRKWMLLPVSVPFQML